MPQESPTHMEQKCAFDWQKDQHKIKNPSYLMKNHNIPQFTPTVSAEGETPSHLLLSVESLVLSPCAKCLRDSPFQGVSQCFSGWDSTLPRQGALVREPDPTCPN